MPWIFSTFVRPLSIALGLGIFALGGTAASCAGRGEPAPPATDEAPRKAPPPPAARSSPLGTNLTEVADYSPEWAFVDVFRSSRAWISGSKTAWQDGRALDLDEHGWVRRLAPDQVARTLMFSAEGIEYPAGEYTVLYRGEGEIQYARDAEIVSATAGRHVIRVAGGRGGIGLELVATNPVDPVRDIRVLMPGGACDEDPHLGCQADADCGQGRCIAFVDGHERQVFHPKFLERTRSYSVLRFMDWMKTNDSQQKRWNDRPKPTDARWTDKGVPVEVIVALANRLGAEPWFTLGHQVDDAYVAEFAKVVRGSLDPALRVHVEHSNEVWNHTFSQAKYALEQGKRLGLSENDFEAQLRWHAKRSVEMFEIFERVFEGRSRLVRVMGSQLNPWASETLLTFQDAHEQTDALAIAPYFGGGLGHEKHQARLQTTTPEALLDELEHRVLPGVDEAVRANAIVSERYGIELVAYEGGQHLVGVGPVVTDPRINRLFDEVNRHPRMGHLYRSYLEGWKRNGGHLFVHFNNCYVNNQHGRWGALESLLQPRDRAPKFDALATFIEQNPRWW
jgi:hypothetical protein